MTEERDQAPIPELRNWALRPRRTPKPVKTYWEEFVETDEWYKEKLCEDIPEDEIMAAFFDEEFAEDEGEEDEEGEEMEEVEEDPDFLMEEVSEDAGESDAESEGASEATGTADAEELSGDSSDSECQSGDEIGRASCRERV